MEERTPRTLPGAVLGIVPARAGSKRVPGKNLRPLAGKPLVARVIEAALAAESLDRVVVSSDSPEVLAVAASYGADLPLKRPAEFATDTAPASEYVRHALDTLEAAGEGPFGAIVILQPSSPFTLPEDIDATVALLRESGADSAVSVMAVDHAVHPVKLKRMEGDRLLPYFEEERGRMAAHELPEVHVRNCAVYAVHRETAERAARGGELLGEDSRGYLMPPERSIDINEEVDLAFAEFLLARSLPQEADAR